MSKLIIIRGNSGSGKSTIAKRLQSAMNPGTLLIQQDVIRREILNTKDTPGNPSIKLIRDIALYGLSLGHDVIVEGILVRKKYGSMLQELIGVFDSAKVYYFDISLEETFRRHKSKVNSREFTEQHMRQWYIEKDYLGISSEKIIDEDKTEDGTLEYILNEIK